MPNGDRTRNHLDHNQALYQLSYRHHGGQHGNRTLDRPATHSRTASPDLTNPSLPHHHTSCHPAVDYSNLAQLLLLRARTSDPEQEKTLKSKNDAKPKMSQNRPGLERCFMGRVGRGRGSTPGPKPRAGSLPRPDARRRGGG